jgi:hypothetical protein
MLSKVEKGFIKKNTQGGRLFVPVDSKSYEYTALQKLLKADLVKFEYDSGSHQVFQITTQGGLPWL